MGATNTTTNLSLSQFTNTDMPAWRQDYNGDMLKIDNAYAADISGASTAAEIAGSDYLKLYDVSASSNTKVLVSDLATAIGANTDLDDISDVDLTSEQDGDVLQYDSTSQKWKNSAAVSNMKSTMTQNGAHNLFELTATTQVVNGATFTMNSNGSITISGKHTYSGAQSIVLGYVRNVKGGDSFIFNGIENAFTSASIDLRFYNSNDESLDYATYWSGDLSITAPANTSYIKVTIYFNNQDFGAGVTIYPMLRLSTDPDPTYAPYAMTNGELTEELQFGSAAASLSSTYVDTGGYIAIKKWGHICTLEARLKTLSALSLNSQQTIATIPSGYIPKYDYSCTTYDIGYDHTAESHDFGIDTNGAIKLTLRNTHNISRWVGASMTYICE